VFTAREGLNHYVVYSNDAMFLGRAKAEEVSRQPLMTFWVRSRPHDSGGGHSITGTSYSASNLLIPHHCHSTSTP